LTDQLRVELGQTRLASVIEDKHGIDHGVRGQRAERGGELEVEEEVMGWLVILSFTTDDLLPRKT
jgi:hypothetical protein